MTTTQIAFALPGGDGDYLLAIDTSNQIWVYSEQNLSGTILTGPITVYDTSGTVRFTVPPGTGGLFLPVQLASDPFGNMWAMNSNLTLSKFGPSGVPLSPSVGFPVPITLPPNPSGASYFDGKYISIDPSGNLWGANPGSVNNCFIELSSAGAVITPSGNFCAAAANSQTWLTAADGMGNAWFEGFQSVSKVNGSGALIASGTNTNGCFNLYQGIPLNGTYSPQDVANAYYDEGITGNLLYDRVNNQLWGTTLVGAGALRADGGQILCDSHGANLPVIPDYYIGDDQKYSTGFLWMIKYPVLDGKGNLWFTTFGQLVTKVNPPGAPYPTATQNIIGGLNAITSSGELITPYNPASGLYGLQPSSNNVYTGDMQIDAVGNIWMFEGSTFASPIGPTSNLVPSFLVKIPGLAVPKNYQ